MNDAATWSIDAAHSSIQFSVKHLMVGRVHGRFRRFSGELKIDEQDLARSSVSVSIEVASVDSGHPARDAELQSAKFFEAERFPAMTFKSRRFERGGADTWRVIGELTLHGVSREVALDTELGGFMNDPWGNRRAGFTARGSVLRSDFGIEWNQLLDAGGVVVGDKVDIAIEVEAFNASLRKVA